VKHERTRLFEQYTARHEQHVRAARWFTRVLRRLITAKRVYQGAVIGYVVFDPTMAIALLPLAVSLVPIVLVQCWLARRLVRHQTAAAFYEHALDRVLDRWVGVGDAGHRYADAGHLYSSDLDIFGRGSLFQFLCTPRTAIGRDTLAGWLERPADVETIRLRQAAVRELADRVDWREALDAAGAAVPRVSMSDVGAAADSRRLVASAPLRVLWTACGWGLVFSGWMVWCGASGWWAFLLACLAVDVAVYVLVHARLRVICDRGHQIGLSLQVVSVFAELSARAAWQSDLLRRLGSVLCRSPRPLHPAAAAPLGLLMQLPAAYYLAVQLLPLFESRLLARLTRLPAAWEAIGQYEALAAFAALVGLWPGDCLPEVVTSGPLLVATGLGHPTIPAGRCVRNDVALDQRLQLLMVSGSNMSGKSTLLRAVGVNAVLALAGAPVCARTLRISPLAMGTAMRFRDSLGEGTSYFYAVLRRLRAVLDLLDGPLPLLFLLDEILPGTNSHDRLTGAEAIIRRLLAGQAIGLVTTHDLELTRVVDHLAPAACNVHFADQVVADTLQFDYRVRPGVVQSSNALALMRSLGLNI